MCFVLSHWIPKAAPYDKSSSLVFRGGIGSITGQIIGPKLLVWYEARSHGLKSGFLGFWAHAGDPFPGLPPAAFLPGCCWARGLVTSSPHGCGALSIPVWRVLPKWAQQSAWHLILAHHCLVNGMCVSPSGKLREVEPHGEESLSPRVEKTRGRFVAKLSPGFRCKLLIAFLFFPLPFPFFSFVVKSSWFLFIFGLRKNL